MSKVACFLFALAIISTAVRAEFVAPTQGSPVIFLGNSGSSIQTDTPTASTTTPNSPNPYEGLIPKLASKVGELSTEQTDSAKAIIGELHSQLTAANQPANVNLAAYLLASAYNDASLKPIEEQLKSDKTTIQAKYFKYGYQGRGFVHFTGAFNYNRFSRDLKIDFARNPALLLEKTNAAKVLVHGAVNGKFTGSKITNFIKSTGTPDFTNARKAINGDIDASSISKLASSLVAA